MVTIGVYGAAATRAITAAARSRKQNTRSMANVAQLSWWRRFSCAGGAGRYRTAGASDLQTKSNRTAAMATGGGHRAKTWCRRRAGMGGGIVSPRTFCVFMLPRRCLLTATLHLRVALFAPSRSRFWRDRGAAPAGSARRWKILGAGLASHLYRLTHHARTPLGYCPHLRNISFFDIEGVV